MEFELNGIPASAKRFESEHLLLAYYVLFSIIIDVTMLACNITKSLTSVLTGHVFYTY